MSRLPFSALLSAVLVLCPRVGPAQQLAPEIRSIRLLAQSRERPTPLRALDSLWSVSEDKDSVIVRVSLSPIPSTRAALPGIVIVEVAPVVARIHYLGPPSAAIDEARQWDEARMGREAMTLPAVASFVVPIEDLRKLAPPQNELDVGVIHPEALAAQLAKYGGGLDLLRLRVTAYLVTDRGNAKRLPRPMTKTIKVEAMDQ